MNARQEIERAVRAAPPYALVETVREALRREYGALRVQLLLADYAMTVLKPVQPADGPGDPLSMHNSPEGRAFGSQEPREQPLRHDDALDHHIPVTVRGNGSASSPCVCPPRAPPRARWTS